MDEQEARSDEYAQQTDPNQRPAAGVIVCCGDCAFWNSCDGESGDCSAGPDVPWIAQHVDRMRTDVDDEGECAYFDPANEFAKEAHGRYRSE